jgi:hypothetical protein
LVEHAAATITTGRMEKARPRASRREIDTSWVGYGSRPGPSGPGDASRAVCKRQALEWQGMRPRPVDVW